MFCHCFFDHELCLNNIWIMTTTCSSVLSTALPESCPGAAVPEALVPPPSLWAPVALEMEWAAVAPSGRRNIAQPVSVLPPGTASLLKISFLHLMYLPYTSHCIFFLPVFNSTVGISMEWKAYLTDLQSQGEFTWDVKLLLFTEKWCYLIFFIIMILFLWYYDVSCKFSCAGMPTS